MISLIVGSASSGCNGPSPSTSATSSSSTARPPRVGDERRFVAEQRGEPGPQLAAAERRGIERRREQPPVQRVAQERSAATVARAAHAASLAVEAADAAQHFAGGPGQRVGEPRGQHAGVDRARRGRRAGRRVARIGNAEHVRDVAGAERAAGLVDEHRTGRARGELDAHRAPQREVAARARRSRARRRPRRTRAARVRLGAEHADVDDRRARVGAAARPRARRPPPARAPRCRPCPAGSSVSPRPASTASRSSASVGRLGPGAEPVAQPGSGSAARPSTAGRSPARSATRAGPLAASTSAAAAATTEVPEPPFGDQKQTSTKNAFPESAERAKRTQGIRGRRGESPRTIRAGARPSRDPRHGFDLVLCASSGSGLLRSRQDRDRDELGHGARRPLLHEGLISKRTIVRGIYAQVVYLLLGADDEKMERMREAMLGLTKGWDQQRVSDIVRETLDEVLTPIIYAEALELIEEHKQAGRKTVIISSSPIETVQPLGEHLGVDDVIATRARLDARGPLHRRTRVLRVRSAQGRRDPRDGGDGRHRPRELVRVLRLDHRPADARAGRQPGRGESRSRAHARRTRTRLGHAVVPASGAAARSRAGAAEGTDAWRPAVRPPRSEQALRCTCGCAGVRSERA